MTLNNFKKKLICWGAGDQFEVIKPIVESLGGSFDLLVDDTPKKKSPCEEIELLNGRSHFEVWSQNRNLNDYGFIIAIGNPYGHVRMALHNYLKSKSLSPVSFMDSSAIIDKDVVIGEGAQIMRGAYINTKSKIGIQCILNTKSLTEHHCILENGVEIGPAATLCGRVHVGENSWIGANATILPRINVEKNVIIGAGSTLTKSVTTPNSVFWGSPASFKKANSYIKTGQ